MRLFLTISLTVAAAAPMAAQGKTVKTGPAISGTWQLEKGKVKAEGPKSVVIRGDSSATWGKETVRWRLQGDQIRIALGGEWETYKIKLKNDKMVLSGGDLTEEITLRRIGAATPRPDSIPVPPDPDKP